MRALLLICLLAAGLAAPGTASARDACRARAPYAGRPLHPPVALPASRSSPALPALDEPTAARLTAAFDEARARVAAPAMTAAMLTADGRLWSRTEAPAEARALFWASAGKSFVAVVILQLRDEGKLSLDDRVSRWVDDVPGGGLITIRDLLAHTSGLFSANEDAAARARPHRLDLPEQLAIVRRHGPLFCPGSNWRYSNTGYELLGAIVARADGRSFDEAIRARIVRPLGLESVRVLRPGGGAAGVAPLVSARETPIGPDWAGPAGPIAGEAGDLVRYWSALLEGRLLTPASRDEMFATLYPMFDEGTFYGLGAMLFDVPDGQRRLIWLGHAGGTPGASAIVAYSPADRVFVAVALTGDGPSVPVANLLLRRLREAAAPAP